MTRGSSIGARPVCILCCVVCGAAQQILIDRGMRAGGLWCFPLAAQPKTYVYLPSAARLATDDAGRPQFSFVRYATNRCRRPGGHDVDHGHPAAAACSISSS